MTHLARVLAASSALLALATALSAQGWVYTVDDDGNDADFTDLQTAVNSAANGDTLLVRKGDYSHSRTTVSAKSLTIIGAADGVTISLRVEDLAASQTVALHRLDLPFELRLADNAGLVWVDECTGPASLYGASKGLHVRDCDRVVLVRSSFAGSTAIGNPYMPPMASAGVDLQSSSTLHAYDCTFIGADGADYCVGWDLMGRAQHGGPGIASSADSFVFLSRCTVSGGDGGVSQTPDCVTYCSNGGDGLANAGEAIVLDSQLTGGSRNGSSCHHGADATGPVQVLAGEGLSFTMSQLGREREDVTFTFQGPPFRPVHLIGSPMAHATFFPALRGSLLVGVPRTTQFQGFTDGTGRLEVVRSIGLLPPSSDIRRLYLQPFYLESGRATLGAGALYVILDERF